MTYNLHIPWKINKVKPGGFIWYFFGINKYIWVIFGKIFQDAGLKD